MRDTWCHAHARLFQQLLFGPFWWKDHTVSLLQDVCSWHRLIVLTFSVRIELSIAHMHSAQQQSCGCQQQRQQSLMVFCKGWVYMLDARKQVLSIKVQIRATMCSLWLVFSWDERQVFDLPSEQSRATGWLTLELSLAYAFACALCLTHALICSQRSTKVDLKKYWPIAMAVGVQCLQMLLMLTQGWPILNVQILDRSGLISSNVWFCELCGSGRIGPEILPESAAIGSHTQTKASKCWQALQHLACSKVCDWLADIHPTIKVQTDVRCAGFSVWRSHLHQLMKEFACQGT